MAAISIRGLMKSYDGRRVVDGLDLSIEPGQVYALLGPNGAGKTTTVEILEGFRHRDAGEVEVLGVDPQRAGGAWRERIGIVFQDQAFEPYLSVVETLEMFAMLYSQSRPIDELLEITGLESNRNKRVRTLSGGQRRRLDLALGLIGDPDLIFLDEPTTGFDPSARQHAWDAVRRLCDLGKTVLLTTHYLDEAQHLADTAGILRDGKLIVQGPPDSLGARAGVDTDSIIRFRLPENFQAGDLPVPTETDGDELTVHTSSPTAVLSALTGWAVKHEIELPGLSVARPSLEDIYLEMTAS